MVFDIIYNISLLLSVGIVYAVTPFNRIQLNTRQKILVGVVIGAVGMLIMSRPVVFTEGIVFDGRSILLGVSGMFFGAIPTAIAAALMLPYRIWMGGSGLPTGIVVIITASAIGVLWHQLRYRDFMQSPRVGHREILGVSVLIHIVMLLAMLLFPRETLKDIYLQMGLPILVVYPIGMYLLALLLYRQVQHGILSRRLEQSELWFRDLFEQAPMGITVTDSVTGKALEANNAFLDIIGMTREEHQLISWQEITHPDDVAEDLAQMQRMRSGEITGYAMDKRHLRSDGKYIWVHMAVTNLHAGDTEHPKHLCMVTDITSRKEMEDAILWANQHDVLTGIENLQAFEQKLQQAEDHNAYPISVLIGDVNGLKVVNDAFGRTSGDELLKAVADVIKHTVGEQGTGARIGGDEFAVLLPNTPEKKAWELAQRIQKEVGQIGIRSVNITMSFGSAVKADSDGSLSDLVKHAEHALSRSKLTESPSAHSRAVHTIISTLHEKNRREELHSRRVSVLSVRIAEVAGMSAKEISELRTAGLLHDIGKIAIDEAILNKQGALTDEEWEAMKRHPETGWRILGSVGELGELATYILSHHERIDGNGYPQGLTGDAIPIPARIIAIADAYDAMTAARTYRDPVSDREAAAEIKRYAGTQFDAALARLFIEQVLQLNWDIL
jgi:diguanylate cyclase (GGDEF)-like protein/PAS domain S-box-containing protein